MVDSSQSNGIVAVMLFWRESYSNPSILSWYVANTKSVCTPPISTANGMNCPMLRGTSNVEPSASTGSPSIDCSVIDTSTGPPSRKTGARTKRGSSVDAIHAPDASGSSRETTVTSPDASGMMPMTDTSDGEYTSRSSSTSPPVLITKLYDTSDTGTGGSASTSCMTTSSDMRSSPSLSMGGSAATSAATYRSFMNNARLEAEPASPANAGPAKKGADVRNAAITATIATVTTDRAGIRVTGACGAVRPAAAGCAVGTAAGARPWQVQMSA